MYGPTFIAAIAAVLMAVSSCTGTAPSGTAKGTAGDGQNAPPPQVGVIALHAQAVPFTASAPGRTIASAVSEVRPQVNGIVQKMLFTEGGSVKAGDTLYEIDDRTYRAAVASANAGVARAEAAVNNAQTEFNRAEKLGQTRVASVQQVDQARAALLQAQADQAAAAAALETASINLANTLVTAPISGLIGTSSVTVGALVTANQEAPLVTIRQVDPIFVDLTESSANLLRIRRMIREGEVKRNAQGATVRITLEDGTPYGETGTIRAIEANVSQTTGTVTARASIPNPDRLLIPGMYVRAEVAVGTGQQGFLLPQRAVSRNAKGQATAFFVSADSKAETRTLDTEDAVKDSWLVRSGVKDGERLIVEGFQKFRAGQTVVPVVVTLDEDGLTRPVAATDAPPAQGK